MKKAELLKTDHQVQLNWLDNQMGKLINGGAASFLNADSAERAYIKMKKDSLILDEGDTEHFISIHLSKLGLSRLITALRVYKKRTFTERLQVEITRNNKAKLDQIVELSGKTKIEIINQLISNVDLKVFKEIK